ncbi:NUDIX hydrolase [Aestuariivirga sp.]|uniref:NUDIX hydrolase n=1 Tax=Aestuariivirga sp. TaxID=2650926 RepID=UPI0025C6EB6A|nr:NUDIX hydrolase [Aestuariivirga sp.]MCA3554848.1 NUDIX domain-containing protein [Aestuariivirga sp.]
MTYDHPEFAGSRLHARVQPPKDSATLMLVRGGAGAPRILMGRRAKGHSFMPNKFVFPGGRLDAADCRVKPGRDLHPATLAKLLHRMRGKPSAARARGLAHAALRETWEETGLLFGRSRPEDAPNLSGLTLFMRAITPPGRTRRFDSRFFVADAENLSNIDRPHHDGGGELLALSWLTLDEIASLDLPLITIDALKRLKPFLDRGHLPPPDCTASFQYLRGKQWMEDEIGSPGAYSAQAESPDR